MSGQATWDTVLGEGRSSPDADAAGSPDVTNISSGSETSPVVVESARAAADSSRADGGKQDVRSLPPPPPRRSEVQDKNGPEIGLAALKRMNVSCLLYTSDAADDM
eukprot:2312110-Rhodomonas_salina.2